ncbi:MAG: DUF839 domain-containing protein [Oligoflexales bacterium]|nr:DUF839 domain-containing protein [Oligoflexales bacterium]
MKKTTRRAFVQATGGLPLLGYGLGFLSGSPIKASQTNIGYQGNSNKQKGFVSSGFEPLEPRLGDRVDLANGFSSYVLAKMGDQINQQGDRFGDCCDFTAFLPGQSKDQAFLWVNHEYINVGVLYEKDMKGKDKSKAQIDRERRLVGGSFLELKKVGQRYMVKSDSSLAFRLDGFSQIPLVGPAGGETAIGTMGNCSGGLTPWGSILSAEENVDDYTNPSNPYYYGWSEHYTLNPKHYGYIVEIDPKNKSARKLTSLGRFAHEGACIHVANNGQVVAYMGDDARFECLYKFVSAKKVSGNPERDRDLLVEGTLYVANLKTGSWEALTPEHPKLKASANFSSQSEICTETRTAAKIVGGTPLNRPEGIAIDPATGTVLIALTNNSKSGDYHGSILAIQEANQDHASLEFSSETVLTGGPSSGISCPDNLAIGPGGFLWAGMDISSTSMGKGVYKAFPRNGFHRIEADECGNLYARRLLLAPYGAEVTGPSFSNDGQSLFLSIQHPGEGSYVATDKLTSHWPIGGGKPISSVIVVDGHTASFS